MDFGSFWDAIELVRLKHNLLEVADPPEREWHTIAARERYWKLDELEAGDATNPDLKYDVIYPKEILVVITLMLIAVPASASQATQSDSVPGGAAESAPMSANELQALVAPIALYPVLLQIAKRAACRFC